MPFWVPTVVYVAMSLIKPRQKQKGTASLMLIPPLILGGTSLIFALGVVRPGIGSLLTLPFREIAVAVLGILVAMGATKDKRVFGAVAGTSIALVATYNVFLSMGYVKDHSVQTVLLEKLPDMGACTPEFLNDSKLWIEKHNPFSEKPPSPAAEEPKVWENPAKWWEQHTS